MAGDCLIPGNKAILDTPQLVLDVDKADRMDVRKPSLGLPFSHLLDIWDEAVQKSIAQLTLVTKSIPRPVEDLLKMFLTRESH